MGGGMINTEEQNYGTFLKYNNNVIYLILLVKYIIPSEKLYLSSL